MTPRARVRGTQKRCVARSSRPGSLHALSMLHEDKERLARRKTIEGSDGVYGCVKAVSPLDEVCVVAGRVGGNVVGSLSAKENTSATHKICYTRGFEVDRQSDEAMGGPIPTTPRTRVGTSDAHLEQWFLDATEQANPRRQKAKNIGLEDDECKSEQMVLMGSGHGDVGRVDAAYVEKVHAMIECCIEHGLGVEETCMALSRMNVDARITRIVWQRLERENPEFFLGLNERLSERRRMKKEHKPMSRCSSSCSLTAGSPRRRPGELDQEMASITAIL